MKKGFTLVEMLIVVVVLVTLMSITFKLSSVSEEQRKRSLTISRLQRAENCLSGYYAAFGTYPPVKLHADRDYNLAVNNYGFQADSDSSINMSWSVETFRRYVDSGWDSSYYQSIENREWRQVEAACRSQPFACRFPFRSGYNEVLQMYAQLAKENLANGTDTDTSEEHKQKVNAGYDDGWTSNEGRHSNSADWQECHLFQFGLMSFLVPRYIIMMNGREQFFYGNLSAQWQANNALPADPLGAGEKFNGWSEVLDYVKNVQQNVNNAESLAHIANIPSQSIPLRWMPNLEDACYCLGGSTTIRTVACGGIDIYSDATALHDCVYDVLTPGGAGSGGAGSNSGGQPYKLDLITMVDGWGVEMFYYSPPPYQSYTVWSAGRNRRTFPPWVSKDGLSSKFNEHIGVWIEDDIMHMSN